MKERACTTCNWWVYGRTADWPPPGALGLCKGGPPIPTASGNASWAFTTPDDWCAAWRPRETDVGGRDSRLTNTDRGTK